MQRFKQFIVESKNVHMTHLEDSIIDGGVDGTRNAINYLRSLRDMLAGTAKSSVDVTVKWDGAPAIFAGTDPSDGKFFVAKKGIFNKNPKVYKTNADIDADTTGDLNEKMKVALKHLPSLGIKGVVQGDFLFSKSDLQTMDIDGKSHITFHPNTIVYAVPSESDLGRKISRADFGVVWHTTYRGESFDSMSASFGKEIASGLQNTAKVFSIDALYKDVSGSAKFTSSETKTITAILSNAGKTFNTISKETFEGINKNEDLRIRVNTFINSKIRAGEKIKSPKKFTKDLINYIKTVYQKEADKKKTAKAKDVQFAKRDEMLKYFANRPVREIENMFALYNLIVDAKLMIIRKLENAQSLGTFLKTDNGLEVTGAEGFVAIDRSGKNVVKLVDRLQFSKANFSSSYIKGWQR